MRSAKRKSVVTMNDVANRAAVSQTTVSYVLNGRLTGVNIPSETRQRVIDAAHELGYRSNQLARAMVTGKSRIIGVLTTPQSGENIVRVLAGAMEASSQSNYLLKVLHLAYTGVDDATIARCLEWRLAGAMIVGLSEEAHLRIHEAFRKTEIPVILVDNVPPMEGSVRIRSDDEQGVHSVVSHLCSLGHSRIAYIGGSPSSLSKWRENSFRSAMAAAGLSVPTYWIREAAWSNQAVIEAEVEAVFRESGEVFPTAFVCSSDAIAMVVLRIARSMGLRLPADLSVTGYSNSNLSEFVDPPLTTTDQSFYSMGRVAAQHLIDFAESCEADANHTPGEILLPTRLIVRGSTAAPPAENC